MIVDLKPYPAYKESGLPWLGQVPVHWTTARTKTRFRLSIEKSGKAHGQELLSVYTHIGVRPRKDLEQRGNKASSTDGYWVVRKGDIIVNKLLAWMGAVGVSHFDGVTSPAYDILRPTRQLDSEYYHFLFRTNLYLKLFKAQSRGIMDMRLRLYFDELGQIPLICPPLSEQAAIVRFLNWANGRLDRTIRAKRKVIALLTEQKLAIIHRAVTRGLDPSVPLKPSGISWLGDIPQHWDLISLRMRYSVELGKMLDAKRITGRHSIPYLRNRDVQWDRILTDDLPTMDIPPREFSRYTVQTGDLLVCEGGQVGRGAFWEAQLPTCGFQKALHRVRSLDLNRDYPRFFFYEMQLAAGRGVFSSDGNENTFAHLTCEKLRRHRFAFPPFAEQRAIADCLDGELKQLQITISRFEREIELLREYRTRLVADVVTGKLDVREAAARLPEEAARDTVEDAADEIDETEEIEPSDEDAVV